MRKDYFFSKRRGHISPDLSERGFSLVELMIAMVVFAIVTAASYSTYIYFVQSTVAQSAQTLMNAGVTTALKLLERDIQMAGFGLPQSTRVASNPNCNVGDETFCKSGTDRIFVADGWEMLRDFTDNQEVDGRVPTPPSSGVDYLSRISDAKAGGGYRALLNSGVSSGATSLSVTTVDIDSVANCNTLFSGRDYSEMGDPDPGSADIKDNTAFIISDTNAGYVEGHRINTVAGTAIRFLANESVKKPSYSSATSAVVPAIAWYVRKDPGGVTFAGGSPVYWLYRNGNKVIPNVDNLEVWYGYDAYPNDQVKGGIQSGPPTNARQDGDWNRSIPPADIGGVAVYPDGAPAPFDFKWLRAVKITITVKSVDTKDPTKVTRSSFTTTVDLKN